MLYATFIIVKSSSGPSMGFIADIFNAFLRETCIAAWISLEHSNAVSLAAATEPSVEEPLPLRESTASLCTFRTSCVALNIPRPKQGLDENGKQRQKIKNEMTYCKVVTQALGAPGVSSTQKVIFLLWCTNI